MAAPTKKRRRRSRSRLVIRWAAVGAVLLIGLFYYRPLHSYIATNHEFAQRSREVHALDVENRALRHRLATAGTTAALVREARQLGWIRPGERLFIVKGIAGWRHQSHHARPTTIGRSG
jgi:Septum formation initiator